MFSRAGWATLSIPLLAGLVRTQRDTETERETERKRWEKAAGLPPTTQVYCP